MSARLQEEVQDTAVTHPKFGRYEGDTTLPPFVLGIKLVDGLLPTIIVALCPAIPEEARNVPVEDGLVVWSRLAWEKVRQARRARGGDSTVPSLYKFIVRTSSTSRLSLCAIASM